ncbi:MAG: CBS domain-containing protein [Rhodobacteraceae bacterium]|nr:CBS domain-containing protein [Paracoccaceae bacterium]
MLVNQILATKGKGGIISIGPDEKVTVATQLLASNRVGALVVLNDKSQLVGIISERDIVRTIGQLGSKTLSMYVKDIMSTKVVTCQGEETADDILNKMTQGRFRHLPVTHDGRLTAMISIGDVVKARLEELDKEKQALEDYIGH